MSYLGNAPARSFISFERQVFSIVNSQTAYALSHSVTNENDIRLVVNNVVQEPGSGKAYTATGTALTLSAALTNGTDEMYCVFLGRATATSAPGAGSIGTAQLAADSVTNAKIADDAISDEQLDPTVITGQTALTSIATDDLILLSDTSASGALKKMTRANFVSGVGGTNTPAFAATISSNLSIANNTLTTVVFDSEIFDSDGKYNTSTGKFTPTVAGKYFFQTNLIMGGMGDTDYFDWILKKNGPDASTAFSYSQLFCSTGTNNELGGTISGIVDLDTDDYVNVDVYQNTGSAQNLKLPSIIFSGFRILT